MSSTRHCRFDAVNEGTFALARDTSINTSQQLIGTGCLAVFSSDTSSTVNNRTVVSGFSIGLRCIISFWFKTNSSGNNQALFSMTRADGTFIQVVISNGSLYFNNGSSNWSVSSNYANNQWHHVYWICAVNANRHEASVDGNVVFTNTVLGTTTATSITSFVIGADSGTYYNPLSGYIDDFRVWASGDGPAADVIFKIGKNTNVASLSGYSESTLYYAGATPAQQLVAGKTVANIKSFYTISEMYNNGITFPQLVAGGITIAQLVAVPYTYGQLVTGGIAISTLLGSPNNYTMPQLFAGGVTIAQFIAAPYTVLQLIAGGITIDNLLTQYTYTQLIDNSVTKTQFDSGGKTAQNLIASGVTISKLVIAQYSFSQIIAGGSTSTQFSVQGYSIADLVNGGVTNRELLSAGYSLVQLQTAGILPAWNIDASANHIIKSYVNDFVDVSGSVVLRENANLYISGSAETAGSLSLNRLFVTADASFNRRIFVGGDVSMNGNVNVIGDLSMNGTVTKCNFNNSSIPKSAFASTVPDGADYNTSKIVYDQTFQANDDVSMNGLIVASNNVKVSGNIVFGDGTVMNTYDNNILSTNPTVFKPSTFTALDICGNLVAGSYATSSDYRIKTNVVELDETYTVDKLRPVKYFQTQINREKYGLIAHELQEHYPDLVIGEKDGSELQRVNYTGLIAILINDIKRLKRELEVLELHQR